MIERRYDGPLDGALGRLQARVVACRACPRLVEYRERKATTERRASFRDQEYWGAPVPSHGDPEGRGPACLLGRQNRWVEGMYSTLAGFVEPGESLEEAVAREVMEESGIRVTDVRYKASQPWPFPSSLMLGFRATARTTAITVDNRELEDAGWFTAGEVRGFGEWGAAPAGEKRLPRKDSISRWLIEGWPEDVGAGK